MNKIDSANFDLSNRKRLKSLKPTAHTVLPSRGGKRDFGEIGLDVTERR